MATQDPFSVPRRGRWRGIAIACALVFVLGIALTLAAVRRWGDDIAWLRMPGSTTAAPAPTAPAAARVTQASPVDAGTDIGTLAAREAALAARLTDLEARTATIDTKAASAAGDATRAEGLLVAFAPRRAIDRGIGLGYVDGQLRERFGATQPRAVATVIQASRAPVTIEDLRQGLDSIAPDLVNGGHGAFWPALRNTLANLIVLHKAGQPSPRPTARLTRARRLLEAGQVEAALAEIERLPGASGAQAWLTAAHRYIDVRRALDVIETAAILGQGAPVTAAPLAPSAPGTQSADPATQAQPTPKAAPTPQPSATPTR